MAEESKEDESNEEDQSQQEEVENQEEGQAVEDIEEQTEGGLLGSYSKEAVLAGGLMLGLALGLLVGYGAFLSDPGQVHEANPEDVQESVEELLTAGQDLPDLEFSEVERRHGMFYMSVSYEAEVPETDENGTETGETTTQQQEEVFYVTSDGELLFPEIQNFQFQSPISIQEQLQAIEEQPAQDEIQEEEIPDDLEEELEGDLEEDLE